MATDITSIGIFGISFSRDLDQTWMNLWLKEGGYSFDFYQMIIDGDDDDEEYEFVDEATMITFEEGQDLLERIFAEGKLDDWQRQYGSGTEGVETDLTWTIDVDDANEADIFMISGNRMLPPDGLMEAIIEVIRTREPRFARCLKEFR